MSKLIVHRSRWDLEESDIHYSVEWSGDYDAQLHNSGCLIVVEYVPDLDPKNQVGKKAELVAIYNKDEWDSVEVEK